MQSPAWRSPLSIVFAILTGCTGPSGEPAPPSAPAGPAAADTPASRAPDLDCRVVDGGGRLQLFVDGQVPPKPARHAPVTGRYVLSDPKGTVEGRFQGTRNDDYASVTASLDRPESRMDVGVGALEGGFPGALYQGASNRSLLCQGPMTSR